MAVEVILLGWSAIALVWWLMAGALTLRERFKKSPATRVGANETLTVFKPLPPLCEQGIAFFATGLESFAAQLGDDEMCVGVHEADRDHATFFLQRLAEKYPRARIKIIYRSEPDRVPNPKIAWQRCLAPQASGSLWLWSDADVIAPPGFLQHAKAEFAGCRERVLTFPYVVRKIPTVRALFEALFVNVEFHPGVLLLRRSGQIDFGFGAGMLFRAHDFESQVDWHDLGTRLADDFRLGRMLAPVRISPLCLETLAPDRVWPEVLRHDLRWSRTIRWNQPVGSFARLLVVPVLGWLVAVILHPTSWLAWTGLLGMVQIDVVAALLICHAVGCHLPLRYWLVLEFWSLWRGMAWLMTWLPGSVTWSGRTWRGPAWSILKSGEGASASHH